MPPKSSGQATSTNGMGPTIASFLLVSQSCRARRSTPDGLRHQSGNPGLWDSARTYVQLLTASASKPNSRHQSAVLVHGYVWDSQRSEFPNAAALKVCEDDGYYLPHEETRHRLGLVICIRRVV